MVPLPALAAVVLAALATPAERAGYARTTPHSEVVAFCRALAQSPRVELVPFGTTVEGRALVALAIAPTKVATPEQALARKKPVVVVYANVHAGEVDGKEAVLALARDYAVAAPGSAMAEHLERVTLLLVPNFNADGNERLADHRPTQNGPTPVGTRANAQGLDLNRDFVKLASPEVRALVRLLNDYQPVAVVDCHTTNGSFHRYKITYDGPRNPQAGPGLVAFGGNVLGRVQGSIKRETGYDSFWYGDFNRAHDEWSSYPALPRYGVQLFGLRGECGVLSESYSYATFPERVRASRALALGVIEAVAADPGRATRVRAEAQKRRPSVVVRAKTVARDAPDTVMGYVDEVKDGQVQPTDMTKDYVVRRVDRAVADREVPTPEAYLIPPGYDRAVQTLQAHGVELELVAEERDLEAESFRLEGVKTQDRPFQGVRLATVEGARFAETLRVKPGWVMARTDQPLGNLLAYLLEPEAEDGLTTWGLFAEGLAPGNPFAVRRLLSLPRLVTVPLEPADDMKADPVPVTTEVLLGRNPPRGGASPQLPEWLDGERFLQTIKGKLYAVDARTGASKPWIDPASVAKSLAALPNVPRQARQSVLAPSISRMNPARTGVVFTLGADLAYCPLDGSPAVRLTETELKDTRPELVEFSPDGTRLAYVRAGNLFTTSLTDRREVRLTTDGDPTKGILNGKADWVYEEEIFLRGNRGAFRWHPTAPKLVFMRFDDTKVTQFPVVNHAATDGEVERIAYPKAGAVNPSVGLFVADVTTRACTPLKFGPDPKTHELIARFGWLSAGDSAVPFAYGQDRIQTKLHVLTWPDVAAAPRLAFTDATDAWVEDLGEPRPLPGGGFLVLSDRTGHRHLLAIAPDGDVRPVTSGDWDVREIVRVDPAAGVADVITSRAGPTRRHLERVTLSSGELTRLSPEPGTHAVSLSPDGRLFADRASDFATPAVTLLRDDRGGVVRTLDAMPLSGVSRTRFGRTEQVTIPVAPGATVPSVLTYPPDFDPAKTYPLWVMTYAGPRSPTVKEDFSLRLKEQAVAAMGVVVLNVDPRSATDAGAKSAWLAYQRLGETELADLSAAVEWVAQKGWVNRKRVGVSGHSYGGYFAAYALTKPSPFTAGIAGAPVTDWHLYDTIYTERYMRTPQENPQGYEQSSAVKAAAGLHGELLICHGLIDDNVHFQNSAQLVEALQAAGKQSFEVAVYPSSRHGIRSPDYLKRQMQFIRRTMLE